MKVHRYRLRPAMSGRITLERFDSTSCGGLEIWNHIDTMEDHEWAHDRLAVCEGRMTAEECGRRVVQRKRARKGGGMNADDVRRALQRAIDQEGTAAAWCEKHDIARGYVSDVLSGRQEPGKAILDALGIETVTTYRRVKK